MRRERTSHVAAVRARPGHVILGAVGVLVVALAAAAQLAHADGTYQPLSYSQNWANTGLITASDDWSGVPGVIGYRGDGLTAANDVDPQTVLGQESQLVVDVNANQTSPDTFTTGGVAEFHLADPVVALNGSGTADAPYVVFHLNTTAVSNVNVSYNLRDLDGSLDNAVQQVALQYRVGESGNFTNVPAGYVADATTGPSLATLVTPVSASLPAAASDQSQLQVRVITTNASGNDEWVGIDDISISGTAADQAPQVSSTTPANGAVGVALDADVAITFSEPVDVAGSWYSISCTSSGTHGATSSGGPITFTLDPDTDFSTSETCTATVVAGQVSDQDSDDPPDTMSADYVFGFSTVLGLTPIHSIQGAAHISPTAGAAVRTQGIVTAETSNGFWMQEPDAGADADPATSEAIFVFTSSAPTVDVGDMVEVTGTVFEFRPGGSGTANLTTTEITSPGRTVTVISSGNPLPPPTVIGPGGRTPPTEVIEDDSSGSVETGGPFDPASDGIDFYESLEAMRVRVNNPVAVGPRNPFGEIPVVAQDGAGTTGRTTRGGIAVSPGDFNPERIVLDDVLAATPSVDTGDHFTAAPVGVLDYSFGNFKLLTTNALSADSGGLARETTTPAGIGELNFATLNVENLDPTDPASKFAALAGIVADNLQAPDLLAVEEVQDNNGATNDAVVDASLTYATLITAIQSAGGPTYAFRQIDPADDQDGGEPGGNIRVGFLFRTDRGLAFVDRPGGDSTSATTVADVGGAPQLSVSPGRVDPGNPAFNMSRKPLVGEFTYHGRTLFAIANHWNSKSGDHPLFGRFQPPTLASEVQRIQQAQVVNEFVDSILAVDPSAAVAVLGDLNDFWFSTPLQTIKGSPAVLSDLITTLSPAERYTYVFDGNSQDLDHILASPGLASDLETFDAVHVNAEFTARASDHDPLVAQFCADSGSPSLSVFVSPNVLKPPNHKYVTVQATVTASDPVDPSPSWSLVSVTSSEPDNAPGGADGNTRNDVVIVDRDTFRLRAERNELGPGRIYTVTYSASDACGNTTTRSATVSVPVL